MNRLDIRAVAAVLATAVAAPVSAPAAGARGVYALYRPHIFNHNVGLVQVEVTNLGFIGNPFHDGYNFGWRGGEYLYIAGLWVGAIASDNLPHVSTATGGRTKISSTAGTTTSTAAWTRTTRRSHSRCSPASTGTTRERRSSRARSTAL